MGTLASKTTQRSAGVRSRPLPKRGEGRRLEQVRVGIIGCGYWGPNLVRNFHDLPHASVAAICDLREERLRPLARKYPGLKTLADFRALLRDPEVDAVAVATPISTHFELASAALKAGKHVLVEKPLCATAEEGEKLIELSRQAGRVLMVGHTFEYNPAVIKVKELLENGELGRLYYIDSVRVNLGLHQSDGRNVIWDLAPHDLSIILFWMGSEPVSVSAWGQSFVRQGVEDVAFVRLEFPGGALAHMHLSWLAPSKIRRITAVGEKKMIIFDDLENVEKLKIADHGANLDTSSPELKVNYRLGDIVSPRVAVTEPLHQECAHFVESILKGGKPRTDGEKGLKVVRVLEAAERSIKKGGVPVRL